MEQTSKNDSDYSRWSSSSDNIQLNVKNDSSSSSFGCTSWGWKKWLLAVAIAVVLFIFGFVLGYVSMPKPDPVVTVQPAAQSRQYQSYKEEQYKEVRTRIDTDRISSYISDYALAGSSGKIYHAGSTETNNSAHELTNNFCKGIGLKLKSVWKRQAMISEPQSSTYEVVEDDKILLTVNVSQSTPVTLKPYVAYTHSGQFTGPPVDVSYGRLEDFLPEVNYTNCVCYAKYGKVNPYNIISRAGDHGCGGVVLYPDIADFSELAEDDTIISNAKSISGNPASPGIASISGNLFQLSEAEVAENYTPPPIPAVSASRNMVKPVLSKLSNASLTKTQPSNIQVTINVNNELVNKDAFVSVCVIRGSVEPDRFVIVGTHHDEAGSGNVRPATGQAVFREVMAAIANGNEAYKPRRSMIFLTEDATYLDILPLEFIEEEEREFGERVVAYVNIDSVLQGEQLSVRSSPILNDFVEEMAKDFDYSVDMKNARFGYVTGPLAYRAYERRLGVPVVDYEFVKSTEAAAGLQALPTCCGASEANKNPATIGKAASMYLKTIMRLASDNILPYNMYRLTGLLEQGVQILKSERNESLSSGVMQDLDMSVKKIGQLYKGIEPKLTAAYKKKLSDIKFRRLNDALIGMSRAYIIPKGVPMVKEGKSIRSLTNSNLLFGSPSYTDYELNVFPGLMELLTHSNATNALKQQISQHVSEIIISIQRSTDYTMRSIMESDIFNED